MPTSRPSHLTWLANKIIELQPKSILDIGIGFGGKGLMFREYTDIWNERYNRTDWQTRIDGVEIYEEYITDIHRNIYNNIYIGNIIELISKIKRNYDLIYIGDVIEHINKDEGKKLLIKLRLKTKKLIVVTPIKVSKQGKVCGNIYETHISQWSREDFKDFNCLQFDNLLVAEYTQEKRVYYCEGMKFFGERLEKYYNYKKYNEQDDISKLVFFEGLYFDEDYKIFKRHIGNKIVFWNGSDVSRLLNDINRINILKEFPDTLHLCHNNQLKEELLSIGINAEISPIFFGNIDKYKVNFKLGDKLSVYLVAHEGREEEYGINIVKNIAFKEPNIIFHIYGIKGINTNNIFYHGIVNEEIMDNEIKDFHCCLRLNKHDGLSQTVIKSILFGHYPIIRTKQGSIWQAETEEEIIHYLNLLKEIKVPNFLRDKLDLNNCI